MIQLEAGLAERGKAVKVMHIVEILDAAYRHDGQYQMGIIDAATRAQVPLTKKVALVATLGGVAVLAAWMWRSKC